MTEGSERRRSQRRIVALALIGVLLLVLGGLMWSGRLGVTVRWKLKENGSITLGLADTFNPAPINQQPSRPAGVYPPDSDVRPLPENVHVWTTRQLNRNDEATAIDLSDLLHNVHGKMFRWGGALLIKPLPYGHEIQLGEVQNGIFNPTDQSGPVKINWAQAVRLSVTDAAGTVVAQGFLRNGKINNDPPGVQVEEVVWELVVSLKDTKTPTAQLLSPTP